MGGLLAFRVCNYDNTAEREQFRYLCERLKAHYAKLEDFCVFAGNYNIGCELDALFIKKDAIIAIEFKNYGGHVIASENGEWTCDGVVIKGGSRKTVLQQARINHSIVKKELKELGVESQNIKDVPTLIIFNQSIELENKLSATTKSWLHITDNDNFIAKLDDITCPKTDLSPLGIVNLAELLNLNSFYLEEFSNASCDKPSSSQNTISICKEIKSSYLSEPSGDGIGTIDNHIKKNNEMDIPELNTEESKSLKGFVHQILSSIIKIPDTIITIHDGVNSMSKMSLYGISVTKKYLVRVEAEGIGRYCSKISHFINHEVKVIGPSLVYWQEGEDIEKQKVNNSVNTPHIDREKKQNEGTNSPILFHKSKTILPHWLDLLLFNKLNAVYSPEYERYEYNLDLNPQEVKVYLGTYFPRSYAESFCIFDDLFKNRQYLNRLAEKTQINILDYGCGTGGELVGLIVALEKYISTPKELNIVVVDGNTNALNELKVIISDLASISHFQISFSCIKDTLQSEEDLKAMDNLFKFHFILNSKMICEIISKKIIIGNVYFKVAKVLSNSLAEDGILYVLDVTTKDQNSGLFYPQLMNKDLNNFIATTHNYITLLPLACGNWKDCTNACFIQQTFYVSHSRKSHDESRVCYRLICYKHFKDTYFQELTSSEKCVHIIHPGKYKQNDESSFCPKSKNGKNLIDTYNIKLLNYG